MSFRKLVEQVAQQAAIDASPEPCRCERTEVRKRCIRGGSVQYVRQCIDCGEPVGSPVKQAGSVPPFDEELKRIDTKRRADIREAASKAKSAEWWGFYRDYMASDEWKALRLKVLARDKGMCQGCITAPASQVHHQTYRNFGHEFAFELISLCTPCHERYHADGDGDE